MSKEEWLENLGDIRILSSDIRIFVYVPVLNLITLFFHSLLLFMFIVQFYGIRFSLSLSAI